MSCLWLQHHSSQSWLYNSYTYSVLPVFPLDSPWFVPKFSRSEDSFPLLYGLLGRNVNEVQHMESGDVGENSKMWREFSTPESFSHDASQNRAPGVSRHACDSLWVSRILLSLFWIFVCATVLHIINQWYLAHHRSKRVGLAIPSRKPDHLLGSCNTWVNADSQTQNVSFKPKSKSWDFKIKTKRTANVSSKFVVFIKKIF